MKDNKILSPNKIAIKRFKKNITGVISLIFIILCGIVALFAYFIIPDKTPFANTQILEISTRKPGFEIDMLLIPKQNAADDTGFLSQLMNGRPSRHRQIPFDSIKVEKDKTKVYIYNPDLNSQNIVEVIPNKDIVPEMTFSSDDEASQ